MSRYKRTLVAGIVAGVLAAMGLAGPAGAVPVKAACTIDGSAKVIDKVDPALGVLLIAGAGAYAAAGTLACAGFVKGVPGVVVLDFASAGTYHNVVCGTGIAVSGANVLTALLVDTTGKGPAFWGPLLGATDYAIQFVGSTGLVMIDQADTFPLIKDNDVGTIFPDPKGTPLATYDAAGAIHLRPSDPVAKPGVPAVAAGECTKGFQFSGAVKLDM